MTKYRLLKDMPTVEAGEVFERGGSWNDCLTQCTDKDPIMVLHMPSIKNFYEWFEEVIEKPKSYQLKLNDIERFYCLDVDGKAYDIRDYPESARKDMLSMDLVYKTEEEAYKHRDWLIAWTTLKYSSNFVPDWNDWNQRKHFVICDGNKLVGRSACYIKPISPCFFASVEDREKSIKDYEREWLIVFGEKETE